MKANKSLVLFLVSCLVLALTLCLGVGAEDGESTDGKILGMETFTFVSLVVLAVVLIVVVVLCIVKREKLGEALRAYRRELKNVTWFPWKSVWRSTVLVIVVVVAVALVIGLLDIAFFEAQYLLTGQGFSFFGN